MTCISGKEKVLLYENGFDKDTGDFVLEGGGNYSVSNGKLYFNHPENISGGSTLWLNRVFEGDLYISYEAMAVEPELAGNLNFFFMARTLDDKPVLSEKHSGVYGEYHKTVKTYIFTFVGKNPKDPVKGWSRMRKDPGFNLLSENRDFYTEHNTNYFFEIIKLGKRITVKCNGQTVHDYEDDNIYNSGSVGFRTWNTYSVIDNFKIYSIK